MIEVIDWDAYFETVAKLPPNPFLATLEPHLPLPGLAYDLGCGVGTASLWLAERGWRVVAVDNDPRALGFARLRLPASVELVEADLLSVSLAPCKLVLCMFTLFLLSREAIDQVIGAALSVLQPGGVFAGQLLGPRDSWIPEGATAIVRDEVEELFAGFASVEIQEVERDGKMVTGEPKHWHIYHVIAKK